MPFSRLAFDVVGPLPRTRSGFKYVLTCMCYASKYLEAIPLKRVDTQSVAEGMVEVYSRTGLPTEILTDQGTVFMSALHKQLCDVLEIKRIRTSPYHPESDGMLERWHASMKSMIKKTELDRRDWDKCLKYFLFAYQSTPHSMTGFSPFELIYGRDVRAPLELLKDGWMSGELPERGLHDWVELLMERMEAMAQLASTREKAGKVRMKQTYDKRAKSRSFEMGSMVLMRVPGLTAKLEDSWEGLYEVLDKTSPVNYHLAILGRARKPCIVHVNMLRPWTTPDARVLRVVVAEEDEDEHTTGPGPPDFNLDVEQKAELDTLLDSFSDVINTTPGRASLVEHVINTSNSPPLRTAPVLPGSSMEGPATG